MDGNGDLPIRIKVNEAYERVMTSVFGSLEQLAKMERAETQANEDKGQLNYHVIMIGKNLLNNGEVFCLFGCRKPALLHRGCFADQVNGDGWLLATCQVTLRREHDDVYQAHVTAHLCSIHRKFILLSLIGETY